MKTKTKQIGRKTAGGKLERGQGAAQEDMAPTQSACPICAVIYCNLSQHLRVCHKVTNKDEMTLLLQLSSGRVKGIFDCKVPDCNSSHIKRLDKHYNKMHQDVLIGDLAKFTKLSKEEYILRSLASLRANVPRPPLVSTLDGGYSPLPAYLLQGSFTDMSSELDEAPVPFEPEHIGEPEACSTPVAATSVPGPSTSVAVHSTADPAPSTSVPRPSSTTKCDARSSCKLSNLEVQRLKKALAEASPGEKCQRPSCRANFERLVDLEKAFRNTQSPIRSKHSLSSPISKEIHPNIRRIVKEFTIVNSGANLEGRKKENAISAENHIFRFVNFSMRDMPEKKGTFSFLRNGDNFGIHDSPEGEGAGGHHCQKYLPYPSQVH
ncbi:uncharacterized protein LOC143508241 [Brachyhypopomus gauderio]|uniref:uncharacterized protein LOC143483374 n=1 Tax=Brachyhypopomus gauderio TaxID=698409 RepID=UPI004043728C